MKKIKDTNSHLTELLQSLIVDLEGEKKVNYKDEDGRWQFFDSYNSALNLAQERIKKLIWKKIWKNYASTQFKVKMLVKYH